MCDPCYRGDRDKEQLKLYAVEVWLHGAGARPNYTMVVLDVDEELAVDNVLAIRKDTDVSKTSVAEIEGPYHSGYMVYFSTLP